MLSLIDGEQCHTPSKKRHHCLQGPVSQGLYLQPRTVLLNEPDKPPKASHKKQPIIEHSPGLLQDTKPLRSFSGNRAEMFLKSNHGIKCDSKYIKVIRLLQHSSVNSYWGWVVMYCQQTKCYACADSTSHIQTVFQLTWRLGSNRLISAQPLIGSTIWEFYISSVLWVLGVLCCLYWQFLSDWSQHVMVDGCRSKLVNNVSRVPQGSVLGRLLFLLYTS